MRFDELLNDYIEKLNISPGEFTERCGISQPTLSRFRNGKRIPSAKSETLQKIIAGIVAVSDEKKLNYTTEEVTRSFIVSIGDRSIINDDLVDNINLLIDHFELKVTDIAGYLGYTNSHFSNIRMHRRLINNCDEVAARFAQYVVEHSKDGINALKLRRLTHNSPAPEKNIEHLIKMDPRSLRDYVFDMLSEGDAPNYDRFLLESNADIEEYSYAESIIGTNFYKGFDGIGKAYTLFFSNNRLLQNGERLFVFDYSVYRTADDYIKYSHQIKDQISINTILRKGVIIDKICRMNRPPQQWSLFIRFWLPLMFCGKLNIYRFKEDYVQSYSQKILMLSDRSLLVGECFPGEAALGRVALTKNQAAMEYYRDEADFFLNKCVLLFETVDSRNSYQFTINLFNREKPKKIIKVVDNFLLAFGADRDLLNRIMERVKVPAETRVRLIKCYLELKKCVELLDETYKAEFYITEYESENDSVPMPMYSNEIGGDVCFTAEEYREMCMGLERYVASHPNMSLNYIKPKYFKNLRFIISEKWTLITREGIESKQIIVRDKMICKEIEKLVI